ncbi:unnamed protein product [Didymodactylos carnosus]|uniref:CMP/dCMP-type deaminase domain-containing protein n=1 Tax=Didymodactylos carnosus TaxID=1234261 RepID=A0A815STY3_9BILA|nr:unnamed protein product [Didymodactylos carnosus]CAF1493216.1 unnamed protein product [Didymodactylos carnosus]CAF4266445.1 unnamed protein product [Didymodactylos carnosus]CAF4356007.1 unnamed protein product [Didymodactylos carnosus]
MEEHGIFIEKQVDESERKEHETFLRMAIKLAEENVEHGLGGPFGAVICKDGKVIANGSNKVVPSNDPTAHAEVVAIRQACSETNTYRLDGCVIYCSCEPCPMCLGAIYWSHVDQIFFANSKHDAAECGFDDHFIYEELARELHERKVRVTQLLEEEGIKAFALWASSSTKTHY